MTTEIYRFPDDPPSEEYDLVVSLRGVGERNPVIQIKEGDNCIQAGMEEALQLGIILQEVSKHYLLRDMRPKLCP